MIQQVFITGASGCIGHYLIESLLAKTDYFLYLLVRNPQKLKITVPSDRGQILIGDLKTIDRHAELIKKMDYLVSTAACWGGEDTYLVNCEKTHQLFSYLDPQICQRAIYFSTASILDHKHQLLKEAGTIGTDYIKSKYLGLQDIEKLPICDRLISLFPTIVFGGNGKDKPYSFISAGLQDVIKYVPYLRWFKTEGSLHFIHAFDIAQIVTCLLMSHELNYRLPERLVMGMDAISVNEIIQEMCSFTNHKIWAQLEITPALVSFIRWLFRIQMAEWDEFCLAQKHFVYDNVKPETFGMISHYSCVTHLLATKP